jgi:hypothetical protein
VKVEASPEIAIHKEIDHVRIRLADVFEEMPSVKGLIE